MVSVPVNPCDGVELCVGGDIGGIGSGWQLTNNPDTRHKYSITMIRVSLFISQNRIPEQGSLTCLDTLVHLLS